MMMMRETSLVAGLMLLSVACLIRQATESQIKPATNEVPLIINVHAFGLLQCQHLRSLKRCAGTKCNSWLFNILSSFAALNSVMHIG